MSHQPVLDFVFFDRSPVDHPFPRNSHQMARALAKQHRVLFVEPPTMSLLAAIKTASRLPDSTPQPVTNGLWRLKTWNFYPQYRDLRRFATLNAWLVRRQVLRAMRQLGFEKPILWLYHVPSAQHLDHLPHRAVVCSVTDDISSFPTNNPRRDEQLIAMEKELVQRADVVFCTTRSLAEQKHGIYLPNAADTGTFNRPAAEPADVRAIPRPRLGVFGTINEYKMDLALLAGIARARTDWSIVVVGDVEETDRFHKSDLPQLPNIHWLGAKSYDDVPAYQQAMDALLIANQQNPNTANSFPLRFFEHLATGKPVVSTPMPALADFAGVFTTATGDGDFVKAIEHALREDSDSRRQERQRLALQHSWDARVDTALEQIQATCNS